jgi:hypothetical protein
MNRSILSILLLFLSTPVLGGCDQEIPSQGVFIGVCKDIERVKQESGWVTIYTTTILWDSSMTAAPQFGVGSVVKFYTPGGPYGPENITYPGGEVSSICVAKGESYRAFYRDIKGKPFLLDKWSVWKKDVQVRLRTIKDREEANRAGAELEAFLSSRGKASMLPDSLVLFRAPFNPAMFAQPIPDAENPGLTWITAYGLIDENYKVGTLREVRALEAKPQN